MAGTINVNQLIPDPGQDLYINTGQYGANLVVGNATTQLLVVSPQGILSSGGTSALGVPSGTTAQRPANPVVGYIRFNTDFGVLENYTANGWYKVSPQQPTITSISGNIYNSNTSTLTITGTNFLSANASVNFIGANNASVTGITPTSGTLISASVPSSIYSIIAGSTVAVTVTNSDGATSASYNMTVIGLPTGGNTVTSVGTSRIHTFNSSGTLTVPTGFSATASYLIVAAGGAGGQYSPPVSYTSGSNGGNSTGFSQTAIGGGGGTSYNSTPGAPATGSPGGSGGGGAANASPTSYPGGSGTPGQGNAGGSGYVGPAWGGGGGGGAGAVGSNATSSTDGSGGVGLSSSITGSPVYYAGGGGGGSASASPTKTAGTGGTGGGGNGGKNAAGTNGTTNTGGGGGAGDSGIGAGHGGGGAGGMITGSTSISAGSYAITVGSGGTNTGAYAGSGGSGIVIVSYTI